MNLTCPACARGTYHTLEEFKTFHPLAGQGYTRESGWTHPDAKTAHAVEKANLEQEKKPGEAKL